MCFLKTICSLNQEPCSIEPFSFHLPIQLLNVIKHDTRSITGCNIRKKTVIVKKNQDQRYQAGRHVANFQLMDFQLLNVKRFYSMPALPSVWSLIMFLKDGQTDSFLPCLSSVVFPGSSGFHKKQMKRSIQYYLNLSAEFETHIYIYVYIFSTQHLHQ